MIVRNRPQYAHPLFPSGLGDLPPTVLETAEAAQMRAERDDTKVNDLSMMLSILSSAFLIFRS